MASALSNKRATARWFNEALHDLGYALRARYTILTRTDGVVVADDLTPEQVRDFINARRTSVAVGTPHDRPRCGAVNHSTAPTAT